MTSRLHSKIQNYGRVLRNKGCLYPLKNKTTSRKLSSVLPISKYQEDKYAKLKTRLSEVPYTYLVDREADRVLQDLCSENDERLKDVLKRCEKIFNYNVRNNETLYPTTLLKTFCTYGFNLDDPNWNQWDSEAWRSAVFLAWCVKLMIASTNMLDDMVDNAILRNGDPCWYKKQDAGMGAISDCALLYFGIHKLLQKHFAGSECYENLLNTVLKATYESAYGQCMAERYNAVNRKQGFDELSFEWYQTLSEYKSASLFFSLPVHLGMHLAGGYTVDEYDFAAKLCLKLGLYIQCQDDYADCFGTNELKLTGTVGSDIRERHCTWFTVKFLNESTDSMKKYFLENYGVDDKDAIANILELYKKANLPEKLEEFNNQLYDEISNLIESMNDVKGYLFYELLADTQKRER